jgi:YHS domain-containing protein
MSRSYLSKSSAFSYTIASLTASLLIVASLQSVAAGEIAIEGYDPVAYFEMQKPAKGSESITHEWLGKEWFFANSKHKDLFVTDPMTYMPNYGGYCSYDPVSAGHDHKIDPTAWRIVDNELYLFFSEKDANHAMPTGAWDKVKAGLSQ